MSPHRSPRYKLWGVYYGPCHQIPPHEDGRVRNKFYVVVRVCENAGQVYCALINSSQANLRGIKDCQIALAPNGLVKKGESGQQLRNPQSWLSVHTFARGGQLYALPLRVMDGHEFIGELASDIALEIPQLISKCKNISRNHKAILLGDADC